jgi:hypothetical protein
LFDLVGVLGWELLEKKAAGPEVDLNVLTVWPLSDRWEDAFRRLLSESEFVRDVSACNVRALGNGGSGCDGAAGVGAWYLGVI